MAKDSNEERWDRLAEYWLENNDFDLNKALDDAPEVEEKEGDAQACLEAQINFMNERYNMAIEVLGTLKEDDPMPEPSEAIPIELFNYGFDVWVDGNRGTLYNDQHESLTRSDAAYWDFSYKQMAVNDTVAAINYITETADQAYLSYVGYG